MTTTPVRLRLGVIVATGSVGVLLALPLPTPPPPPASTGPLSLAQAAPEARTVEVPGVLPDGSTFAPSAVVNDTTVVGRISSPDYRQARLAILPVGEPAHARVLQSSTDRNGISIDAVTVSQGRVYWSSNQADDRGATHATLWSVELAGGPPRRLTPDMGQPDYRGSQYDLQVVGDRIYWVATRGTDRVTSEVRSVPVGGGTVQVRPLDGSYTMNVWPWLTSAPMSPGQPTELRNLTTGERRAVPFDSGDQPSCSPTWCRSVPAAASTPGIVLSRSDGTGSSRISNGKEHAVAQDVALLDRFELLAAPVSDLTPYADHLALYDVKTHRRVALGTATAEGTNGRWIWWATGDNEALTWHLLDLTTLH
jgi:hypothetical protein